MTTYKDPEIMFISNHEAYTDINVEGANNKFINDCANIFLLYDDVQFYYVAKDIGLMPRGL